VLDTKAFAAFDPKSPLRPWSFARREPGDRDVLIHIEYCGICHSDVHQVRDEWGGAKYPMVPGHEIVGTVAKVGARVTKTKVGDRAGVGCMVGSCRSCASCKAGDEQYCERHVAWTYNGTEMDEKTPTQGGYATQIVVDEDFVLRIARELPADRVAPLLCAGITTYSPLRHWNVARGQRVGVVGLGGLGHMAVKIAAAMGAEVTVLSHSPNKRDDAKRLGAHDLVVSTDDAAMKKLDSRLDLIVDTVSAPHDVNRLVKTLRRDGSLVLVGLPEKALSIEAFPLVGKRRRVAGSLIGGIRETQEMLDFCAEHNALADIETIPASKIDEAYERMLRGDVRYRFVIDCSTL
jgi:uncharacterized zinc-type alcohol dehydrogenase-like protein